MRPTSPAALPVACLTAAVLLTAVGCTADPAPAPAAAPDPAGLVGKAAEALRASRSVTVDFDSRQGNSVYTGTLSVDAAGTCVGAITKSGKPLGIGRVEVIRTPQGAWYRGERSVFDTSGLEQAWERYGDRYVTGQGADDLFDGAGICRSIGYYFDPEVDPLKEDGATLGGSRTVAGREGYEVAFPGGRTVVVAKGDRPVVLQDGSVSASSSVELRFRDHGGPVTAVVPPADRTVRLDTVTHEAGVFEAS
ncbi:hypothetical protein ACIRBX_29600 [Kitasatospora sp. NPDC096147]|uniref:hypothetical protein n=1 Tax=Kitasatospora sp. NPDC096147 TaxID=3364093 RepID=UPI00380F8FB4